MDRRKFLKRAALATLGGATLGGVYPFLEAKWCRVLRRTIAVPNLPRPFRGTTVALLADVHHGPFVPLAYIRDVVEMTNALEPDIVLLAGDYMHRSAAYIAPGIAELGKLEARMGRFAVRGNHDNRQFAPISRAALAEAKLPDLNNTGVWLERGGARLRIAGVGDFWTDVQDLGAALGDATRDDAVILLSHNPDFVEDIRDPRVGPGPERTHSRRAGRRARLRRTDRALPVRPEVPARPRPGAMRAGVRHPRRRHRQPARPLPLPARGRADHAGLARVP